MDVFRAGLGELGLCHVGAVERSQDLHPEARPTGIDARVDQLSIRPALGIVLPLDFALWTAIFRSTFIAPID